jgi:hypothetical protein
VQHTPSVQLPVVHSRHPAAAQSEGSHSPPWVFWGWHLPFAPQKSVARQSASVAQPVEGHASDVPLHASPAPHTGLPA